MSLICHFLGWSLWSWLEGLLYVRHVARPRPEITYHGQWWDSTATMEHVPGNMKSRHLSFEINCSNLTLPLVIPTPLSRNRFKQAGSWIEPHCNGHWWLTFLVNEKRLHKTTRMLTILNLTLLLSLSLFNPLPCISTPVDWTLDTG